MNYSQNTKVYGNKEIRGKSRKRTSREQRLLQVIFATFMIGAIGGSVVSGVIVKQTTKKETPQVKEQVISVVNTTPIYGLTTTVEKLPSEHVWSSYEELQFEPLDVPMDEDIQQFIYWLSSINNVDFTFVMGLIKTESSFRTDVVSTTNDFGLMQINKVNHEWLEDEIGVTDFMNPYENVRAGIYILSDLFQKYEDPHKVLMAYNFGEKGAKKLWSRGVVESKYSRLVMKNIEELKGTVNAND